MGHLYEDNSLWDTSSTDPPLISTWIEASGLHSVSRTCKEKLSTVLGSSFVAGEVHGAAFLDQHASARFVLLLPKIQASMKARLYLTAGTAVAD